MKKLVLSLCLLFSLNCMAQKAVIRYFKRPLIRMLALCPNEVKGAFVRVTVRYKHPDKGKSSIRLLKDLATNKLYANAQQGRSSVWHKVDSTNPVITWEFDKKNQDPILLKILKQLKPYIDKYEKKIQTKKVGSRETWKETIELDVTFPKK